VGLFGEPVGCELLQPRLHHGRPQHEVRNFGCDPRASWSGPNGLNSGGSAPDAASTKVSPAHLTAALLPARGYDNRARAGSNAGGTGTDAIQVGRCATDCLGMMACGLIAFVSSEAAGGPFCLGLFVLGAGVYGIANLGATFRGVP
jgi:hypothetical protein